MAPLGPRESARLIMQSARDVSIKENGVCRLSKHLLDCLKDNPRYINFKSWKNHSLNPKVADEKAVNWIFLVDALNFSFWSAAKAIKYCVRYDGEVYTGYWSLCAAINRALDQDIPITSSEYMRSMTMDKAKHVFRSDSDSPIPMLQERVDVMNEIGTILCEKYGGSFVNVVQATDGTAQGLLRLVAETFPCFRDEGYWNGTHVSFYKRAQILVADLWACYEGEDIGNMSDIDSITMFADYRIPQSLMYFGVLEYSEELMMLLKREHMFESGEDLEMEIRAASIHAVELLAKKMNDIISVDPEFEGVHINSISLDHFLWDYRRAHDSDTRHIPYHKIRCIFY